MSRIEEAIKLLEQIKYLIIEHEGETQYDCNFQGVDKAIKLLESEPEPMVSKEVYDQLHIDFIERGAAIDLLIAANKRLEVSLCNLSETLSKTDPQQG